MTFMTYTASTEIIFAHTIISRRFTEMKQNTDYVHKIFRDWFTNAILTTESDGSPRAATGCYVY